MSQGKKLVLIILAILLAAALLILSKALFLPNGING